MSEPILAQLEKITPAPGDVILMRRVRGAYDEDPARMPVGGRYTDPLEVVQQWIVDRQLDGILIVALADDQEFALLDRDQMRRHGWVRAEPEPASPDGANG